MRWIIRLQRQEMMFQPVRARLSSTVEAGRFTECPDSSPHQHRHVTADVLCSYQPQVLDIWWKFWWIQTRFTGMTPIKSVVGHHTQTVKVQYVILKHNIYAFTSCAFWSQGFWTLLFSLPASPFYRLLFLWNLILTESSSSSSSLTNDHQSHK